MNPTDRPRDRMGDDGPDIDTLARLIAAEEASPAPMDPKDREAVWASVRPRQRHATRWRRPLFVGTGVAVGLAAAAMALVVLVPDRTHPEDAVKSAGFVPPGIELLAISARNGPSGLDLDKRVSPGEVLSHDTTLLFELDTDGAGARYLFTVEPGHDPVVLWPMAQATVEPSGRRRLSIDGQWVALGLSDLSGDVTLVAASSAIPLDVHDDVVAPWVSRRKTDLVAYDSLTIRVAP